MWVPIRFWLRLVLLYELRLHSKLVRFIRFFDIHMLKKSISEPDSILPIEGLAVDDNISYEEVSDVILDH